MKLFTIFELPPTFAGKCQQRVMTIRSARGMRGRGQGRNVAIGQPILAAGADGARLFQRLRAAEAAAGRRRRRHAAVRAGAAAPPGSVPAAQSPRNHAGISRSHDPGAEALEVRHRLDGRGVPAGGHAAAAKPICLSDLRRRLQGCDDIGLSGAVPARRALHGLPADRVSGRGRRSLVARARGTDRARKPHQPGDRPQGAAFHDSHHAGKSIRSTNFCRAGCARWRRRIFHSRSTISARDTRSTSRRCRAAHRWTGTIWRSSRPIRW